MPYFFLSLFHQESGLALLLKREVQRVFQDSKMIAVAQNNASNSEDMMLLKYRLYKHGIAVKFFPNQVQLTGLHTSSVKRVPANKMTSNNQRRLPLMSIWWLSDILVHKIYKHQSAIFLVNY